MSKRSKAGAGFGPWACLLGVVAVLATALLCVCVGSVPVPPGDVFAAIGNALAGRAVPEGAAGSIILHVRLPRVLTAALVGAALSLAGAAMQGLLRNPLADGSTLGVSSGASLGAVLALAFGISLPGLESGGTVVMAMLFAFLSMLLILSLAHRLDYALSTNTIILIGVIFSMFASSWNSLIVTFAGERVRSIMFWMMGSLAGSNYGHVLLLFVGLAMCGGVLLGHAPELNAFAVSEENAMHVGIDVRRVKLVVLITVSVLIGISVSVGGTIGFVGLVIPHMLRFITGPNHKRLLPACLFGGAVFLMLADLASRVVLKPLELPIGVVTSLVGSVVFVAIFYARREVH